MPYAAAAATAVSASDVHTGAPAQEAAKQDPHSCLAALLGALREHMKAYGATHVIDGSSSSNEAQLLSLSSVVLPLLPVLATLGQVAPSGAGLQLSTLKVCCYIVVQNSITCVFPSRTGCDWRSQEVEIVRLSFRSTDWR